MLYLKIKYFCLLGLAIFLIPAVVVNAQHRAYYDKYEYKKKRHEINLGIGASSCLTDLGGSDMDIVELNEMKGSGITRSFYDVDIATTRYVINAAYLYHFTRKLNIRTNLSLASVSADDAQTQEYYRNNRNLNFQSPIIELSSIVEFYLTKPTTGTKYNLKNTAGKRIAPSFLSHLGFYFFGGVGGFYYNPKALINLSYDPNVYGNLGFNPSNEDKKVKLRELHTEGQGMENDPAGFENGKTYKPIAICFPMGFGIEKAFDNDMGIKIEGGFRYTNTDYLDDVSREYYNRDAIEAQYGNVAATLSGTHSGDLWEYTGYAIDGDFPDGSNPKPDLGGTNPYTLSLSYTEPGFQRGNPNNKDSYAFVVVSVYKKLKSQTKAYRTINMHQKRKIKASF